MPKKKQSSKRVADLVPMTGDERRAAMQKVTLDMKGWRPARQVLRKVQAVPTIFPSFDRGVRVGGLPLARVTTLHGVSNHGKTVFALGLELSFLQADHFVAHVDAEMSTPVTWLEKLMGSYAEHPGYMASRPRSFEEVDDNVRRFLNKIGEAKASGMVPPDTSGLIVVDSVKKLVPKNLLAKLLKDGADKVGMDGMSGRGAMHKANLNAQWLDELIPMLHDTNCSMVLIAREAEDPNADANDRKYGRDYKIGGGKAIIYDASIVARVERAKWLYLGDPKDGVVIGERHRVDVWKTKVAGKEDSTVDTYFHTSNGAFTPEGFDRQRDVLELAIQMKIVTGDGWYSFDGTKLGQGENQSVKKLHGDPDMFAEMERRVRAGFVVEGQEPEPEVEAVVPARRKKRAAAG